MSTVEVTLVVSRKEVPSEDEAAYHFFFLKTSFFFNKLLLSSGPALRTLCCNFAPLKHLTWYKQLFTIEVSALIPKHLIWYKQLFAI